MTEVLAPESTKVAVVLTAIQAETEAVLRHLDHQITTRAVDTWFHIGQFGLWTVAVAEVGPGNAPAATIGVRAFTHFKPEVAAFVGVAGGLKDVLLGDVVVATKVYGYESGKETSRGFHTRPDVQTSDHELQTRARVIRTSAKWHSRLDIALWKGRKPNVYVGPIAAGETVVTVNAGRIATQLKEHYGDALAVEMEGRGFLEAAHIEPGCRAIIVRGISDLLDSKTNDDRLGWQQRSADAAAAFFFEMLALEEPSERPRDHHRIEVSRRTPSTPLVKPAEPVRTSSPESSEGNRGPDRRFCAIMYADVVHSSEITADVHKNAIVRILSRHLDLARAQDSHLFSKALGDGLLVCLSACSDLAEIGLNLQHEFRTTDWKRRGFARDIQIRVGLDFQMVTLYADVDGKIIDGASSGLDRASRIEPVTLPNRVFCTEFFYKGLVSERVTNIIGDYFGPVDLPKNAGTETLYSLKWREEPSMENVDFVPKDKTIPGSVDTTHRTRRPDMRALARYAVAHHFGHSLAEALSAAAADSRHLVLQHDDGQAIGILVGADEFNLLMKLSAILSEFGNNSGFMRAAKEGATEDDLPSAEVFDLPSSDTNKR